MVLGYAYAVVSVDGKVRQFTCSDGGNFDNVSVKCDDISFFLADSMTGITAGTGAWALSAAQLDTVTAAR